MKELVFLTIIVIEVAKDNFSVIIATVAKRKLCFIKT